ERQRERGKKERRKMRAQEKVKHMPHVTPGAYYNAEQTGEDLTFVWLICSRCLSLCVSLCVSLSLSISPSLSLSLPLSLSLSLSPPSRSVSSTLSLSFSLSLSLSLYTT